MTNVAVGNSQVKPRTFKEEWGAFWRLIHETWDPSQYVGYSCPGCSAAWPDDRCGMCVGGYAWSWYMMNEQARETHLRDARGSHPHMMARIPEGEELDNESRIDGVYARWPDDDVDPWEQEIWVVPHDRQEWLTDLSDFCVVYKWRPAPRSILGHHRAVPNGWHWGGVDRDFLDKETATQRLWFALGIGHDGRRKLRNRGFAARWMAAEFIRKKDLEQRFVYSNQPFRPTKRRLSKRKSGHEWCPYCVNWRRFEVDPRYTDNPMRCTICRKNTHIYFIKHAIEGRWQKCGFPLKLIV